MASALTGIRSTHVGELFMATALTDAPTKENLADTGSNFTISANKVKNVIDIGMTLGWEKNRIDIPTYGEDTSESFVGQKGAGELTFSFINEFDNTLHAKIRDQAYNDNGIKYGFCIKYSSNSTGEADKITWAYMAGYLQSVAVNTNQGEAITVDVTVAVTGRRYEISNS